MVTKAGKTTTQDVYAAIIALRKALIRTYGEDYAFSVSGHGDLIAASNFIDGDVVEHARLSPEPSHKEPRKP